uniref:Uncharacterized protein n=1 Tax=Solanum tuberosum TaxID=4113 RepID=M1BB31_SOLTU
MQIGDEGSKGRIADLFGEGLVPLSSFLLFMEEYFSTSPRHIITHETVTIYQFKATKEKHFIMLDQAIMESILSCKSKLLTEVYYCSIQATNEMVWPYQVMLSCKHSLMLVQANHWKGIWIEEQSKHTNLQKGTKRVERMQKDKPGDAKYTWRVAEWPFDRLKFQCAEP